MFKKNDVVEWCGALGIVTKVFRGVVYCDFFIKEGSTYHRDAIWFLEDGRQKPYHREPSLFLADAIKARAFRENPPVVLRGVDFGPPVF